MSIFYTFLLFISFSVSSTTFKPVGVDVQLKEADGVIIGHYLKSKYIQLEDGSFATQMIFKMNKEWGMQSDLFGMDEIIIHYPGGSMNGNTSVVQGVPKFVVGEKVALLAKNVDNRFWGLNLGFGSFKVINYGNETMLINSVFPQDSQVGQIKLKDFELLVKEIKGSNLKAVSTIQNLSPSEMGRLPASYRQEKSRAIASDVFAEDNKAERPAFNVYWLLALLAFSGAFSRFLVKRGKEK